MRFINHWIKFIERQNKTKFIPTSFPYFLELLWEKKINFSLKSVIVIAVTTRKKVVEKLNKENLKMIINTFPNKSLEKIIIAVSKLFT